MSETLSMRLLPGEVWWGGVAHAGHRMPLGMDKSGAIDPCGGEDLDQCAPLFLSSAGRFLWSGSAFSLRVEGELLRCEGTAPIRLSEGHGSLRGAYLAASRTHFAPVGGMPDARFFSRPQYNTWIELKTGQTQEAILAYARGILSHGLPAGILMIDEGWAEDYGVFEFNRRKIPEPAALVSALHEMGFAVMLWVTPAVSPDGPRFKELRDSGLLLRDREGNIAMREWWNGCSAVLDLTSARAAAWMDDQLRALMDGYGIDGFKFDAGDRYFYRDDDRAENPVPAREQTLLYNRLGERYALCEFRAAWNSGGRRIVARLQDKLHSWGTDGLAALIPNTIAQGLLGYAYCCPDMVGGGDVGSFTGENQAIDEELFVRWAQASACMGMLQMSISPWRVLSEKNAALVTDAMGLHARLAERICALAREASRTGEPIVRHMAYVFPGEGFEQTRDQFMLGDDLLVCPVLQKGAKRRAVRLPAGRWRSWRGEVLRGGEIREFAVELSDIPRFERL